MNKSTMGKWYRDQENIGNFLILSKTVIQFLDCLTIEMAISSSSKQMMQLVILSVA